MSSLGFRSMKKRTRAGKFIARPRVAKSTGAKLARLTRQVALLKPEVKCLYLTGALGPTQAAGDINPLSLVAQGTDAVNRVGDTIRPVRIDIMFKVSAVGNPATPYTNYGVYLVKDLESNGTVPVIAGTNKAIFENFGPTQALVNDSAKERFKVLASTVWMNQGIISGGFSNHREFHQRLSGVTTFSLTTGVQASLQKNSYYLVALSDDAANTVAIPWAMNFYFTDV